MYYQDVIDWIKRLFPNYRKEIKGIDWGLLFNTYKNQKYNSDKLEEEIIKLMNETIEQYYKLKKNGTRISIDLNPSNMM